MDKISIRNYKEEDFQSIEKIYIDEGWTMAEERTEELKQAINQSQITLVAIKDDEVVGFLRAITDGFITIYLAELIVHTDYRGQGIGKSLINSCHGLYPKARIDLLGTTESLNYYKKQQFRPFYGFRKSTSI